MAREAKGECVVHSPFRIKDIKEWIMRWEIRCSKFCHLAEGGKGRIWEEKEWFWGLCRHCCCVLYVEDLVCDGLGIEKKIYVENGKKVKISK